MEEIPEDEAACPPKLETRVLLQRRDFINMSIVWKLLVFTYLLVCLLALGVM